jgi:hypothetical protein
LIGFNIAGYFEVEGVEQREVDMRGNPKLLLNRMSTTNNQQKQARTSPANRAGLPAGRQARERKRPGDDCRAFS